MSRWVINVFENIMNLREPRLKETQEREAPKENEICSFKQVAMTTETGFPLKHKGKGKYQKEKILIVY